MVPSILKVCFIPSWFHLAPGVPQWWQRRPLIAPVLQPIRKAMLKGGTISGPTLIGQLWVRWTCLNQSLMLRWEALICDWSDLVTCLLLWGGVMECGLKSRKAILPHRKMRGMVCVCVLVLHSLMLFTLLWLWLYHFTKRKRVDSRQAKIIHVHSIMCLFICTFESNVDLCGWRVEQGCQMCNKLVITAPSYTHVRCD